MVMYGGTDPRVLIDVLPDNVLLETFEFYLGKDDANDFDPDYNYDGWQTLVRVCRRWRCIVFASPRRLDHQTLLHSTTISRIEDARYLASIAHCHSC